jgi:glycosidase
MAKSIKPAIAANSTKTNSLTMNRIILIAFAAATAMMACQPATPVASLPEYDGPKRPEWAASDNIYEVNVRQYTEEGTLKAFQSHLPRLAEMGVDILWFMPIQPIGVENRKGELGSYYSISDYTAVNPNFGTLENFQSIVNQAHELGMKVILDWVANHTSFDHVWITEQPEFYTKDDEGNFPIVAIDNDGNPTDWTDVADLNYDATGMREAMIAEMDWWIANAGIDGFRCDVAGFVPIDFWNTAITTLRANNGPLFMLAEWEDPALIEAGFNAVYGWEFHHIMNEVATGHKSVSAIAEYTAKCDTVWPTETMKMYFNTNHDENSWNGTVEERMGDLGNAMYILASMMKRSFPLIYSGQEAGLNHRYPFFSKDTVGLDWSKSHAQSGFFAQMLALKHKHQALFNGELGYDMALEIDTATNSMRIWRGEEGETDEVIAIFEFSEVPGAFEAPENFDLVIEVKGAQIWASKLD